jgi:hypothetical protein
MELRVQSLTNLYSQLCGVLAGFAFAGFSIYVTSTELPPHAAGVAVTLFSAFGTLVLVAALYALLSGDTSQDRATVGLFVYGLPFGLAILALFYALTLIAANQPELSDTVWVGRVLVVAVGPVLVLARLTITALAVARDPRSRGARRLGWVLTVVLLVGGAFLTAWPALLDVRFTPYPTIPAYLGLGSAIVATLLSPLISTRPATYKPGSASVSLTIVISFLTLAVYAWSASTALLPAT